MFWHTACVKPVAFWGLQIGCTCQGLKVKYAFEYQMCGNQTFNFLGTFLSGFLMVKIGLDHFTQKIMLIYKIVLSKNEKKLPFKNQTIYQLDTFWRIEYLTRQVFRWLLLLVGGTNYV